MISGYGISTTDIFSRRVEIVNTSSYQVNRGKVHIAKNENESYSQSFTMLLFFHAYFK